MQEHTLQTHDFYYDLPQELIAQKPVEPRDSSRLMTLDKETGEIPIAISGILQTCCVPATAWF